MKFNTRKVGFIGLKGLRVNVSLCTFYLIISMVFLINSPDGFDRRKTSEQSQF